MRFPINLFLAALAVLALVVGCTPSSSQLKKVMKENPDILFEVIEENPLEFSQSLQKAHRMAQTQAREEAEKEEKKQREEEYKNPKEPEISPTRAVMGPKDAAITIVEYSDFQCPYCRRGYTTINEVKKKYGDKVRVIFKHLPLDFHPLAMPAAQRFEAIALQSGAKAYKFHDLVFDKQGDLQTGGEKLLDSLAKQAGADMAKMKKDMKSDAVNAVIKADMEEARKFGISGTPGFVVAGITLKGAYPIASFSEIIDKRMKELGK